MGYKFRRSKSIAPGIKLNFSNKGMGVSFGGKRSRYSISPTGRRTTSFKVAPGLTYTTYKGGRKNKRKGNSKNNYLSSYQHSQEGSKSLNSVVTFFLFLSLYLLWFFGIVLSWNTSLLIIISILAALLFTAFMLINNVPHLKSKLLNLLGMNKTPNDEQLLALQKILIEESPDELVHNENELLEMAQSAIYKCMWIGKESISHINLTADPEIFFDRYNMLLIQLKKAKQISEYVELNGFEFMDVFQETLNNKLNKTDQMIDRYWCEVTKGIDRLKTINGKKNRYQKFYDTLKNYNDKMNNENVLYYTNKYETAISDLNNE